MTSNQGSALRPLTTVNIAQLMRNYLIRNPLYNDGRRVNIRDPIGRVKGWIHSSLALDSAPFEVVHTLEDDHPSSPVLSEVTDRYGRFVARIPGPCPIHLHPVAPRPSLETLAPLGAQQDQAAHHCHFLRLPREVRDIIYGFLLEGTVRTIRTTDTSLQSIWQPRCLCNLMYALEDFGGPQSFVINEAVETFFQERTALSVLRVCKQVCDEARGSLEKSTTHELDVLTQGHWDIEAMRRHFRTGALHGMEAVSISIHCSPAVFREILRYRLETLVSSCLRDIHCPRRLHINVHESLTYAEEQQRANAAEYLLAPFLVLRNIRECEVYCRASVEWLRNFKATTGTESLLQKWLPDERRNPLFNHQQEHKHRGAMTIHRI